MTEFKTSLGDIVKQKAAWTMHKESLSQKEEELRSLRYRLMHVLIPLKLVRISFTAKPLPGAEATG